LAPLRRPVGLIRLLLTMPRGVELSLKPGDRAEGEVALEDQADDGGLARVDYETLVPAVVAERQVATHP
jgi:hypothetical protein